MCAGYGGIGLGIKRIFGERLRTIAYCELEGFAQANLISKMEKGFLDVAPIWSDLKTFPYGRFHGLVDILIAGYPCQPFSAAGKRGGKEDPRHLWPYIADGIRILRPRMCFFENVEGHISLGLSSVISDLEELGYKVSWGIFSAREVGAPHQRKRVFILAYDQRERVEELGRKIATESQQYSAWDDGCVADSSSNGYDWRELQDRVEGRASDQLPQPHAGESCGIRSEVSGCGQAWPSRPGEPQHEWEPPRVVGNSIHDAGVDVCGTQCGQAKQSVTSDSGSMGNASNEGNSRPKRKSSKRTQGKSNGHFAKSTWSEIESSLGRDPHGSSYWMVYAELYTTCDNRTDELRLLGNGVVPATAERAFRILIDELITERNKQ